MQFHFLPPFCEIKIQNSQINIRRCASRPGFRYNEGVLRSKNLFQPEIPVRMRHMSAAMPGPVWIDPPRFWSATAGKSDDEVSQLLELVSELWRAGDVDALMRFSFVTCVGYPYSKRNA